MQYKAVVTDLDGTALNSPASKVVSSRLANAVIALTKAGIKVCAATGRPESFAMPVISSMGLAEPCIVAGGTRIINPATLEKLWSCDMPTDQAQMVVDVASRHSYGCLWNDYVEQDYEAGGWDLAAFKMPDSGLYFLEVCYVPKGEVDGLLKELEHVQGVAKTVVVAHRPGTFDIHITNATATKEHAIYELKHLIGTNKAAMIGVGDGPNDGHLFNAVGHKVAMQNAVPELLAQADEVIGDVAEDGLAEYFEKLAETGGKL